MKRPCLFLISLLVILGCTGCQRRTETPSIPDDSPQGAYIDYMQEGGIFELPVAGSSGYAAIDIYLFDNESTVIGLLKAGQGFTILHEDDDWWYIEVNNIRGWVFNKLCMINLPDIIPSIVYHNTNTYSSLFRSSRKDIPNITGVALYAARDFNVRLGREEYISPVLYGMAEKIQAAQSAAIINGDTLIIYESFRPADAHNKLHENFSRLAEVDPAVREGITNRGFNIRWFLAESPYNHQRGTAIDASLGKIDHYELRTTGGYVYTQVTGFTEYPMQTPMHELSTLSAILDSRVNSRSETSWRGFELWPAATAGTALLLKYCASAGLTPLSSEWWHYNDLPNTALAVEWNITGGYSLDKSYSRPPAAIR